MKKIILCSLFLGSICNLSLSQVYTPNGTVVEAHTLSAGDVALFEAQAAGWLADHNLTDSVQRVGAATREYNCHSFAWNISEGGNNVWVNAFLDSDYNSFNPYNSNSIPPLPQNISKYWDDGSYIQVSNESLASKVWYGSCWTWTIYGWSNNCDHSAVRLSSGLYKSKWGSWPLYIHAYNDCPYTWSNRKYYIKRPSLSGPSVVCDEATYTIENLPAGATVQWSASNNSVILVSGQGTDTLLVKKRKFGGPSTDITANIHINNIALVELTKTNIQVGTITPSISLHDASTGHQVEYGYAGRTYYFEAQHGSSPPNNNESYYQWEITSSHPDILPEAGSDQKVYYTPFYPGTYTVSLRYHGECGWSDLTAYRNFIFVNDPGMSFTLSPNPATDMVTVRLEEETAEAVSGLGARKAAPPDVIEIQLWSAVALLRAYKTDQSAYQISVSDLPKGMYFVRVIKDGKIHTQKLLKN